MMKTLSKSEIKTLQESIKAQYGVELFDKKDLIQLDVENKLLYSNKQLYFFTAEDRYVPTLKLLQKSNFLKKITVDMGAVKFVVGGADVMRPGVVEVEDGINAGDFVSIIDVNNKKPLAVGKALFNSKEMRDFKTGRVVKSIHYVGDEIWGAS